MVMLYDAGPADDSGDHEFPLSTLRLMVADTDGCDETTPVRVQSPDGTDLHLMAAWIDRDGKVVIVIDGPPLTLTTKSA